MEEAKGYRLQGPQEVQGVWHHHAQHWVWQQQEDQALDAHRCARRQLGWLCRLGLGPCQAGGMCVWLALCYALRQMPVNHGMEPSRQAMLSSEHRFSLRAACYVSPSGDNKHALWTACGNNVPGKLGQPLPCHVDWLITLYMQKLRTVCCTPLLMPAGCRYLMGEVRAGFYKFTVSNVKELELLMMHNR